MKRIKNMIYPVALMVALLVIVGCQQPVTQVDKGPQTTTVSPTPAETSASAPAPPDTISSGESGNTSDDPASSDSSDETQLEESTDRETSENPPGTSSQDDEDMTIISVIETGFSPSLVNINVGDTVRWVNERTGRLNTALILGNRECSVIKSKILKSAESYEFTFTSPMSCVITEGISTQHTGTIVVE